MPCLPPNLFYGTGIPATIIVVDKENAQNRKGVFMIDAGKGFIKDGNKNRLREQDIKKITDVFNDSIEVDGFSRLVPLAEIEQNKYNLNIPRYIDSTDTEDIQDIEAHLRGDIPTVDVDDLDEYWKVYPTLKSSLFGASERNKYSMLKVDKDAIKGTIFTHPEFVKFQNEMNSIFSNWKSESITKLKAVDIGNQPKKIIAEFNPELELDLSKLVINETIADNQNNYGAQNYDGLNQKIGSYKFSKIEGINQLNYKPIFLEDGLIFFDKKGNITRYDTNNEIIWQVNHYSKAEKKISPKLYFTLDNQNLLITDNIAKYYSINIKYGELNWLNIGSYSFNSEIKKTDNKFFTIDYKNTLRSFDINDGTELWNFQTDDIFTMPDSKNSLIIVGNLVIFNNSIGDITAVDVETGQITWQLPTQSSNIINESYNFKTSKLVSDGKSIFFSNNKGEFYSVDVKTGITNWINEINSNITPTVTGNLIFTISNEGYLYLIEKNNGNIIRVTDLYKNYKEKERMDIKPIGFVIGKTNLYLTNDDGKMIVVDLITGKTTNTIKVSNSFVSEPFIFNKNLFIIQNGSIDQYN